jgi:hypothetical protein
VIFSNLGNSLIIESIMDEHHPWELAISHYIGYIYNASLVPQSSYISSTSVDANNVHAIKCQHDNMSHTHLFKGFFGKIFLGIQKSSKKS